jgi:tRNA pseudouridine55 synthase
MMPNSSPLLEGCQGILLVDKPVGKTSFSLVGVLRRILGVRKIGHAGTLDPFATGVMVLLIGHHMTRLSDRFLSEDKEYVARVQLGVATDTHDCDGEETFNSPLVPTEQEIQEILKKFQGETEQIPPMHSAKKVNGKKLYELARKGQVIERKPVRVVLETEFLKYEYPYLEIRVKCSKGTYIRTIADDMGKLLGCGAHLAALQRTRSGPYKIENCFDGSKLFNSPDREAVKQALFLPEV